MTSVPQQEFCRPAKKQYAPPQLKIYGNLGQMTQSNSGMGRMDHGTGGMKTA